ncbi:serrate RNA effector molecule homolog [Ylistrum balloti]|uniref:serrate RNA effector molecule homolog n=1 Tax=Ylistrum balloti TaxID=509963 RepID=UPI002905C93A|nr:serrate RNA effector molecule homolog [Ylistrum balloti]
MGDSDEEYDRRKGRDKFRRERNDYERRGDDRRREPREIWELDRSAGRSREMWNSRSGGRDRRDNYREYDSRRRERGYSPSGRREMSPPNAKRMRRENWYKEDGGSGGGGAGGGYPQYDMGGGGYGGRPMHGGGMPPQSWGHGHEMGSNMPPQQQGGGSFNQSGHNRDTDLPTQPSMMSFKQFLSQQDDSISDQEAIKKYNEYKMDFKRQQTHEFFLAHKEEEWFKTKYHPEECEKRQEEIKMSLRQRCRVFTELLQAGRLDGVTCDTDRSDHIVKLLDAAVIKMEGGTDFDLTILDQPDQEEGGARSRNNSESVNTDQSPDEKKRRRESSKDKKPDEPLKLPISAEQKELMKKAQEFSKQQQAKNGDQEEKKPKKKKNRHRDKTEYSYESGSESESGTGSESEPEPAPPGLEDEAPAPGLESSTDSISMPGVSSSTEDVAAKSEDSKKEDEATENEKDEDTAAQMEDEGETTNSPKPRALHKTCSIFLRNLAPSITKQEVEAMCKRYPGFIRVALQDPQPERNFFRRGWVTFERDVNIKEICWNLNNIRLRDCELGATLNRELKQRVRPINGVTAHRQIVTGDIKIAAKVIHNLDKKWCIWDDPEGEKGDKSKEQSYSLMSRNPVLKNITDYLVEEGSFEEEELLGQSVEESEKDSALETGIERDENIIKALDRMILYLRIVHSIDYYSANEYPNEDEMPHRCGIMHARGPPPLSKLPASEAAEWTKSFEEKLKVFSEPQDLLAEAEAAKLGKKDPEAEVEKFVTANTQELAKDKWLCPMSGKKFKGPEFVRKHLFNKHAEKVEEVKKEVTFFNNYLLDPKRPSLPEHPGNKQGSGPSSSSQNQFSSHGPGNFQGPPQQGIMGYGQPRHQMMFGNNQGQQSYGNQSYGARGGNEPYRGDPYRRSPYPNSFIRSSSNNWKRNNEHRRSDPRGIIEYRDLDAPDDADIF